MNTRRMQKKHTTQVALPLPGKPKGVAELTDADLEAAVGGKGSEQVCVKITIGALAGPIPLPYPNT